MPSSVTYLLAVTLLTLPPDIPEPLPDPETWAELQEALVTLAIEWEILDPRETRYVFARLEDFDDNINLMRRRHRDLRGAPKLADGIRFPDHRLVNDYLSQNRSYRKHLEGRQSVEHDRLECLRAAMKETDELYQVWDAVRDARCEYYYVVVRRQALRRLLTMLGPDDYATGQLPPYLPIWRFADQ
ncbi:MAG: hypothetical protein K1X57_01335 [Gemmataceae bacterium]|nr:hypothetical protein [Gemmataceae bacterium]